ncbi:CRP-like cAMP-binding protein [Alkalibaculum bacchi]|jgi:CRP-like cAMP-binding protein|uniref:CRP-like cAMP-binding protein n=1 Tax=Alkalibaculum bacchi TaxID=645887 RepID=A0A366I509_9FIRM|nr:Crp/Fnr family transcriptional regulator [Alkalibaculum bacchi]RBP63300.1 CRP-like cAMP-binding protein [Alkalibaculum bacchi]
MDEYINDIKNTTLINCFSVRDIELFLKTGKFKIVSYTKNTVIHFDGDMCCNLEIILSGSVIVERIDEFGNLLTISEFSKDDIVGGNLLYSKNPYFPMTIVTQSRTSLLEIDKETLFELLTTNSSFLRIYLQYTSDRTFLLGHTLKSYIKRTIRECIIDFLNIECKKQDSKQITLNITKKALAEKIGVQRTSLSRELTKMKKDGLIDYDTKTITMLE